MKFRVIPPPWESEVASACWSLWDQDETSMMHRYPEQQRAGYRNCWWVLTPVLSIICSPPVWEIEPSSLPNNIARVHYVVRHMNHLYKKKMSSLQMCIKVIRNLPVWPQAWGWVSNKVTCGKEPDREKGEGMIVLLLISPALQPFSSLLCDSSWTCWSSFVNIETSTETHLCSFDIWDPVALKHHGLYKWISWINSWQERKDTANLSRNTY